MLEAIFNHDQIQRIQDHPVTREAIKWLNHPSCHHSMEECRLNPFEHGLDPDKGFDCSAYVKYVLQRAELPNVHLIKEQLTEVRHCNEFFDWFGVHLHWGLHQAGDLVFFSFRGKSPTHIGIVLTEDRYIHAPGSTNSRIQIANIIHEPITTVRQRQLYLHNPIGFKRIAVREGRWNRLIT